MPFRTKSEPRPDPAADEMSLTEHLAELRTRIVRTALAVLLGMIVVMAFYDQVLNFLVGPYQRLCESREPGYCGTSIGPDGEVNLFALDPIEGLSTRLRVSMWGGIILALPVIMWQLWRFVVPALHAREKKYAIPFILSTVILFCLGGALAYTTLERALEFLIDWSGSDVDQAFQVNKYIRLVGMMIAAFGIGFTVPVFLVFLQLVGVLTPQILLGAWRYAIVGTVLIAAVVTPSGDPISLAALSVPMIVLYFVAILIGWLAQRSKRKRESDAS